ncbi:hypothetical protein [Streptomyces sp. NRRL S-378]|uniref:hypothetical protein n=1 Tax=Streptomyces sp. NRRL S-378 TaxID=1463904 RepID=UPI0004C9FA6E|nr:hypothetical protein [Streptomyces sp. NRRL S-378]
MNATITITTGTRVRVTRFNSLGKVHFVKTGTVEEVSPSGAVFRFREDFGPARYLSTDPTEIERVMKGWSQSYEVL